MAKKRNKYSGKNTILSYEMGGIKCETVLKNEKSSSKIVNSYKERFGLTPEEDYVRVMERNNYNDKMLRCNNSGIILGFKNGNCYVDDPLKIPVGNNVVRFYSCYPLYFDKNNICIDKDNPYINGKDIYFLVEELRKINSLLRIDATMTSGYCKDDTMAELITGLNTRGSYLDVW